jgi:hypothetical protein
MRILEFLKDSQDDIQASGLIFECGLAPVYHRVFSAEEQRYIEDRQEGFPFTRGEYIASRLGEHDMISDLALFSQRFCTNLDEKLLAARLKYVGAQFLIEAGDWCALHLFIQEIIRDADNLRVQLPAARDFTKECCEQHIRYAHQIKGATPTDGIQGEHLGYWVMSYLLEEESNYDRALHYAEQGQSQGWDGNWEARISHLQKLAPERSTKTTIINLSGGRPAGTTTIKPTPSTPGHQATPPVSAQERHVACLGCGQKMRIPATFTRAYGACVKCGHRVDIPPN